LAILTARGPSAPTPAERARGCALAAVTVEAAGRHGLDPAVLAAVAWRESRWRLAAKRGGHCGAWQVGTRWSGLTCPELQQAQPGAESGAAILAWHARHKGDLRRGLEAYAGCKRGCAWYSGEVLGLARALTAR
jgi:hypothetical protein